MKKYNNPIKNDPYAILWATFRTIYPDCRVDEVIFDELEEGYGLTNFADDGTVSIVIDINISVANSVEILAHELAHAAVGKTHEHDDVWAEAFDLIYETYTLAFQAIDWSEEQ